MILALSPSPSRLTTVPEPYFGCSTVMPGRAPLDGVRGAWGSGFAGSGGLGNCGAMGPGGRGGAVTGFDWNGMPRSPKNWEMFSSELYVLPVNVFRRADCRTS